MRPLVSCRLLAVSALIVLAGARTGAAQDPYRQTVVVTAAATPIDLANTARAITVISREEIAGLPVTSVADVLRLFAAVDVRARGERGVQTDFSIRGAGFGQMLILVDGVRLNDPQSGHHNGDIPVPLDSVERIEVLHGPGSSFFGADAFGGTVNVITRARGAGRATVSAGSFGSASVSGGAGITSGSVSSRLAGAFDRTSGHRRLRVHFPDGFTFDRDFTSAIVHNRTAFGERAGLTVSALRKEFGATNFYGGNAPSREWTDGTLVAADYTRTVAPAWKLVVDGSYRTHGDRFVFDQRTPARSDNRHRTHTVLARGVASRPVGRHQLSFGVEGGHDWLRSTNLGNHDLSRLSAMVQWRHALGATAQMSAAVRSDAYAEFGTSWNPSLEFGWWASSRVKVRTSAGRAFRVPTFTERFYSDPANLARAEVRPEHAWSGDGGMDLILASDLLLQVTAFRRGDRDVIDWLRPTAADLWRTYNVRAVDTTGVEVGVRKRFAGGAFVLVQYSALDVEASAVTQLSKYALDYAPQSLIGAAVLPLAGGLRLAPRIEYRRRSRPLATEEYVLLDLRAGRRIGRHFEVYVDGFNLLDRAYHEVGGVPMPGASVMASVAVGR
jgi:iron complex outermembrane receptor protein